MQCFVSLTLASGQPTFIAWGEHRTLIYNDAYIPLLRHKHPRTLGLPFFDVWKEAEAEISPLMNRVFRRGRRCGRHDVDEPTVRMLVAEVIDDLGCTALEAADGAAALKLLESNRRIDLIVTDVGPV